MIKLFLDDYRVPLDCISYMHSRIGKENPIYLEKDWIIVRSYNEFVSYFNNNLFPDLISFDHDLADEHYNGELSTIEDWEEYQMYSDREMTGYDCVKWLLDYCKENNKNLPKCYVHSMNPVGTKNIQDLINNFC